jgi:hypothetical protein
VLPAAGAPLVAYRANGVGVNVPDVWWTLGDGGNSSSNGGAGWVRLFGRSIHLPGAAGGGAQLRLVAPDGKVAPLAGLTMPSPRVT